MSITKTLITAAGTIGLIAFALPAAATTLSTPLGGGNNQSGIMFDVAVGSSTLTLQSIDVNINEGTYDFQFYTLAGGIGGNSGNAGVWTLRDSFSSVTTAGAGNLTSFDIADLGLAANSVYGLYFTSTVSSGPVVIYSNGSELGDTVAANADLSIYSGYGKAYPFADTYAPRDFNGALNYSLGGTVPEPASWALMIGGFGMTGFAMRRRQALRTA